MTLTVAYLGNFEPEHSTENHVRQALEHLGHVVVQIQEGHTRAVDVPAMAVAADVDLLLWTQTFGLAVQGGSIDERAAMLDRLATAGIPTVSYHLDRWWGLDREGQVDVEPFFRTDLVVTADGGHDDRWDAAGVEHVWMPPGVSEFECVPTEPDPAYAADVAFVGNWTGRYHPEWRHRRDLVRWLRRQRRARMWPQAGHPAVRGEALRKVYASTTVAVGDSCLVGDATRYWSDRIPETLGRGGFLLHPWVEGIDDHFTDGEHLRLWQLGDWRQLDGLIGHYLAHPDEAHRIASAGREHVMQHHTYTVRMRDLLALVADRGLL